MSLDELLQLTDDAKVTLSIRVLKSFAKHVITETCQQMRTDTALGVAEKMVTINEACITLRTTRHTLDRWHSIGYLRRAAVGGKLMYRMSDILNLTKPQ